MIRAPFYSSLVGADKWHLQLGAFCPPIDHVCSALLNERSLSRRKQRTYSFSRCSCSSLPQQNSLRCAVLGAGFAGLSVAWHLLSHSPKELKLDVDIFDEVGIGGGASGVAGGLLHPYSPKVKPLWRAEDCWRECLHLVNIAEEAATSVKSRDAEQTNDYIVRRRGILRPAVNKKNLDSMLENAQNSLASCQIEIINEIAAKELIPSLCAPLNTAFFMPDAVNINPQSYLKALFLACEKFVTMSSTGFRGKSISLHKKFVPSLQELDGHYDAVVVCLGARVDMLPELSGVLPLRTCRGIVAHLGLCGSEGEEFPDNSPSILSDAWIAPQSSRTLYLGSTWEWGSRNHSSHVSSEEASRTLQQLLPKACTVFPKITNWTLTGAHAGLRAMPPLSPEGSFPLLGCIDELVNQHCGSKKYWLVGGLGARGLLYHGWLGKLTAQALLSGDEGIIPAELISWKKILRKGL